MRLATEERVALWTVRVLLAVAVAALAVWGRVLIEAWR
jgi:hypothetical protein